MLTAKLFLGRWLMNIPVYVHWTLYLMLFYVFAVGIKFGVLYLCLFGIVLLHEYGHCYAAKRYRIRSESITLTPMGGIASIQMPQNAKKELVIALAGPAVNVAFIPVLYLMSYGHHFFTLVGYYNLVILLFNCIPALPMDGGRVLRSVLARFWTHYQATLFAARVAQVICVGFGIVAVLSANIILGVVAIFVWIGATQELEYAGQNRSDDDMLRESLEILRRSGKNRP